MLQKHGVRLISALEPGLDGSHQGDLVHGILASLNEYRSVEDGLQVSRKMLVKAQNGGTIGMAPLGYLNTLARVDGVEVRDVAIDEERTPFIKLAYELYLRPDASVNSVTEELQDRGFTTKPTRSRTSQPVPRDTVERILRNPYYVGLISFKGNLYRGKHEPLISVELFNQVQRVMKSRNKSHERRRVHHHYLKGTLFCAQCYQRDGRLQRLVVNDVKNRHGYHYQYFFCPERMKIEGRSGLCTTKYTSAAHIEEAIAEHYKTIQLDPEFVEGLRAQLAKSAEESQASQREHQKQLKAQLEKLDRQEERLIEFIGHSRLSVEVS